MLSMINGECTVKDREKRLLLWMDATQMVSDEGSLNHEHLVRDNPIEPGAGIE